MSRALLAHFPDFSRVLTARRVVLTADAVNNSNPFAWADVVGSDASTLSFAVGIGTYSFDFLCSMTSALSTTRALMGVNGPTKSFLLCCYQYANSTNSMMSGVPQSAYDTSTTPASFSASGGLVRVYGTIVTTAAGTLTLRSSSNVNGSHVTVKQGSFGVLYT